MILQQSLYMLHVLPAQDKLALLQGTYHMYFVTPVFTQLVTREF